MPILSCTETEEFLSALIDAISEAEVNTEVSRKLLKILNLSIPQVLEELSEGLGDIVLDSQVVIDYLQERQDEFEVFLRDSSLEDIEYIAGDLRTQGYEDLADFLLYKKENLD